MKHSNIGRSSIPRATIDLYVKSVVALYKRHPVGGALHIITDDQNVEDHCLSFCRKALSDPQHAPVGPEETTILDLLEPMTPQERYWLVSVFHHWNADDYGVDLDGVEFPKR